VGCGNDELTLNLSQTIEIESENVQACFTASIKCTVNLSEFFIFDVEKVQRVYFHELLINLFARINDLALYIY
jgi:hypothetical protein